MFERRRRGRRSRTAPTTTDPLASPALRRARPRARDDPRLQLVVVALDLPARGEGLGLALLGRRQRLGDLAVVAVDRDGLDAQPPRVDVELLDVLDGHVLGHVHGLRDRAGDERLDRPHHLHVPEVVDDVVAHRAGEDGQVLGPKVRRAEDRLVLVDVRDDLDRSGRRCSRAVASARGTVWLTIDIVPPPTSFFVFTSPRSGSTPVVSQSMRNPIVPVGASTVAWELRTPYCSASSTAASQDCLGGVEQLGRHQRRRRSARPRRGASAAR